MRRGEERRKQMQQVEAAFGNVEVLLAELAGAVDTMAILLHTDRDEDHNGE